MSHSNKPPGLPHVVDEAGDTASWVPLVGLALAVVVALLIALRQAFGLGVPDKPVAADAGKTTEEAPAAEGAAKPAEAP